MINSGANSVTSPRRTPATSTFTGRAHSQSVTAVDIPRSLIGNTTFASRQSGDVFADVMQWKWPSTSASENFSTRSLSLQDGSEPSEDSYDRLNPIIIRPFGKGISFDSPSRKSAIEYLPTPRLLREMQSFESGLTARQSGILSDTPLPGENAVDYPRPPSAFRIRESTAIPSFLSDSAFPPQLESETEPPNLANSPEFTGPLGATYLPKPETALHSRYSTDVFDVLQTYRGLPLLDKLSPETEETTVIKLSLSDDTAAPRDDPRFVIWGELHDVDPDDISLSQHSLTDLSSSGPSSSMSKKRSTKGSKAKAPDIPALRLTRDDVHKVLLAATIERWIAQLTSDLNYDELLNFFLTYRTYISAVDLCHLLICRFHWALQKSTSRNDESTRRVVRVRTFVAIRYWLLTFFTVDFLPDRELRLLVANWLNDLIRDPILKMHSDGLVSFYVLFPPKEVTG